MPLAGLRFCSAFRRSRHKLKWSSLQRRPNRPRSTRRDRSSFVGVKDIFEYKALPEYHEPAYVTELRRRGPIASRRRASPQGAAGLQDRQHARRHRRLRRRHAPRHRRPAAGLELLGRPQLWLGRRRQRNARVPDPHRSPVRGQGRGTRAAAQPRQELGMVRGRAHPDDAHRRGHQVVRRRSLRPPKT